MRRRSPPKFDTLGTLAELNVTPLLDLAFVLLIIFMITAPFLAESANLIIPTSKASREAVDPNRVHIISLDREGTLALDGSSLATEELAPELRELAAANPDLAVVIKADRSLTVAALVRIMDEVKNAGITRVGVLTKPASNRDG